MQLDAKPGKSGATLITDDWTLPVTDPGAPSVRSGAIGHGGAYPCPDLPTSPLGIVPATAGLTTSTVTTALGLNTSAAGPIAGGPMPVQSAVLSPFVITPHYDNSITSLGTTSLEYQQITGAITSAIQFYESEISTNETISINFGFGEVGGTPLQGNALGESIGSSQAITYGNLRTALLAHASAANLTTLSLSLPAADPTNGGAFQITTAEAKALGISTGRGPRTDGFVGISNTAALDYDPNNRAVSGETDAIGVLEHEISEVMGRVQSLGTLLGGNVFTPLDLFRYASQSAQQLSPGAGYFSIDGGATNLGQFNDPTANSGDAGDWASSIIDDAFDSAATIAVANTISANDLTVLNVLGYTVPAPCYAAGTRIRTANGDRCVEDLQAGDLVQARFAGLVPIKWIGHRRIDCSRHADPREVCPVRVVAEAFGPGQPARDLLLSPEHGVAIGETLVPIRLLVNGAAIRQETGTRWVHYFHIELDRHDLLLAEGLAAESYLDTGNRGTFANAGEPLVLHPRPVVAQRERESLSCLPFRLRPEEVLPAWQTLAVRSAAIGIPLPGGCSTEDPAPYLLAGGRRIDPVSRQGARYTFVLPAPVDEIRLCSRHAVPSDARPWLEDRRDLGVMVGGITLRRGLSSQEIALDDPRLTDGWWAVEDTSGEAKRWTNGHAALRLLAGPAVLEVRLADKMAYPVIDAGDAEPATEVMSVRRERTAIQRYR